MTARPRNRSGRRGGQAMKGIDRRVLLFVAAVFVSWCSFATRPSGWTQLAAMISVLAALVCLFVLVVSGIARWQERGIGSLISCALIIVSLPLAIYSGHAIRHLIFSYEQSRWNQAVTWVVSHETPNQDGRIRLPSRYSDLAYAVHYGYDKTCGLRVDFFWGGGFPVKHTVRRYSNNAVWTRTKECYAGWAYGRSIADNWYEISD